MPIELATRTLSWSRENLCRTQRVSSRTAQTMPVRLGLRDLTPAIHVFYLLV